MGRAHVFAAVLVLSLLGPSARAQWAVFDASNFAENVLQAARSLEQINNQIRSLQNEAAMLETMNRNLRSLDSSSLGQMTTALSRINGLMSQATGSPSPSTPPIPRSSSNSRRNTARR
ncbi:DUF4141 domain-containing protein [Magnetospirillum molischianum]|nr:DUF4141 domain-containing protein [Magnetospirillum molischianum]